MKILLGGYSKVHLFYYKGEVTVAQVKDDGTIKRIDSVELNDLLAAVEAFKYLRETERVERKCGENKE